MRRYVLGALALSISLQVFSAPGETDSMVADQLKQPPIKEQEHQLWVHTSLVKPQMVSDVVQIDSLLDRFLPHKRHPLCRTQDWPYKLDAEQSFSLFPFLLRRSSQQPTLYAIPFIMALREGFGFSLYQPLYTEGPCAGLGYVEADFKGRCALSQQDQPALALLNSLPETVLHHEGLSFEQHHLPNNGVSQSYPGLLYELEARLLGVNSNSNSKGFVEPLSTFDQRLFSRCQSRYVNAADSFKSLVDKCPGQNHQETDLVFGGSTSQIFLGHFSEERTAPADQLLQVKFTPEHQPVLAIRNAMLSASDFVNYGFFTEAELLVLQDLDYNLNPRDFYGFSIYTSGSPDYRAPHLLATGYAAWDEASSNYNHKQYSRVPLGVGAHIYGNYNQVEQLADIVSAGTGAIGVRIDGSGNRYKLNDKYNIYEQGQQACGIVVAYGHDNELELEGTVAADSSSGVGVLLSYGSNLRSDLLEYQGSYHRVRSYDYQRGLLSKEQAQNQPLPEELRGPLLKRLTVSGMLRGGRAAISIDSHAHVEEIYFKNKAQILGDLISEWEPYEVEGEFYLRGEDQALLPALLQLECRPLYAKETNFNLLPAKLKTKVIFGAKNYLKADQLSESLVSLKADDDAFIEFGGGLYGNALNVYSVGGQTRLRGSFNVNRLEIGSSVLHLEYTGGKASQTHEFRLDNGGVLDLVNSSPNTIIVDGDAQLDSRSMIHVDINEHGAMIDRLWFNGEVSSPDGKINIEPGLNFELLKRFSSDPKALYVFIRHFMVNTNHTLKQYGLQVRFPRHIWLDSGDLGREIRCGIHDCHVGQYVAAKEISTPKLPLWRYLVSAVGLCLLLLLTYLFMHKKGFWYSKR